MKSMATGHNICVFLCIVFSFLTLKSISGHLYVKDLVLRKSTNQLESKSKRKWFRERNGLHLEQMRGRRRGRGERGASSDPDCNEKMLICS